VTMTGRGPRPGPDPLAPAFGPRAGVRLPPKPRRRTLRRPSDLTAFVHWARWSRDEPRFRGSLDALDPGPGAPVAALARSISASSGPLDDVPAYRQVEPEWARPIVALYALKAVWDVYVREPRL